MKCCDLDYRASCTRDYTEDVDHGRDLTLDLDGRKFVLCVVWHSSVVEGRIFVNRVTILISDVVAERGKKYECSEAEGVQPLQRRLRNLQVKQPD
jgi:hypothetical protein